MEGVYNLCNVTQFFYWKKVTKTERGKPYNHFKLEFTLAQLCKTHFPAYVDIQIPPLPREGVEWLGALFVYVLKKNTMLTA
jgi:hypothetical protein